MTFILIAIIKRIAIVEYLTGRGQCAITRSKPEVSKQHDSTASLEVLKMVLKKNLCLMRGDGPNVVVRTNASHTEDLESCPMPEIVTYVVTTFFGRKVKPLGPKMN